MDRAILDQIPKEDLIRYLIEGQEKEEERIGIVELCDEYLGHITNLGRSPETLKTYRSIIDRWISWTTKEEIKYAHEVKRRHTNRFYANLILKEFAKIDNYKRLKAIFNYALDMGYIGKNPFYLKLQFPKYMHDEYWTPEYFSKLTHAIRRHAPFSVRFKYELITRILFTTGMRIGKLMEVTKKDIKFHDNEILITTARKTCSKGEVQTHIFHLRNKRAIEMLRDYIERVDTDKLFPYSCVHTAKEVYREGLKKVCKKADIEYRNPHQAKHGFITMLAEEGYSAEQACDLTGNTDVDLVRGTYMHFKTKKLADETAYLIKDL